MFSSRMRSKLLLIFVTPVLLGASTIYDLNQDGCTGGCGTNPFGTVTLTQDGTSVDVSVSLLNGDQFIKTGAGESLEFDLSGSPTITVTALSSGFSSGGTASASTFGSFSYSIDCSGCGPGASSPNPGPIDFTVSLSGGGTLSVADFVANDNGNFFASDIIGDSGNTGNVASNSDSTPEPSSIFLIGLGLVMFATRTKNGQK